MCTSRTLYLVKWPVMDHIINLVQEWRCFSFVYWFMAFLCLPTLRIVFNSHYHVAIVFLKNQQLRVNWMDTQLSVHASSFQNCSVNAITSAINKTKPQSEFYETIFSPTVRNEQSSFQTYFKLVSVEHKLNGSLVVFFVFVRIHNWCLTFERFIQERDFNQSMNLTSRYSEK